jgi:hypothetical protein
VAPFWGALVLGAGVKSLSIAAFAGFSHWRFKQQLRYRQKTRAIPREKPD